MIDEVSKEAAIADEENSAAKIEEDKTNEAANQAAATKATADEALKEAIPALNAAAAALD